MSTITRRSGTIVMALGAALSGQAAVASAQPGTPPSQMRVKISLVIQGSFQHTGPKPAVSGFRLRQFVDNSYSVEYVIPAETILTGLQKTNPMDPASQQEMDEYNAKVKAQADRVYHSADNLRHSSPAGGAPRGVNTMAMVNPEMVQKVMACGSDKACKQRLVMEMMSQQPGANAGGRKGSTVPASAADDEPEVPELPDRYLIFRNYNSDCGFKGHTKINESITNLYPDTGGWVEQTQTATGEGDADPTARQPCALEQAVFDTRTNTFWLGGFHPVVIPITARGQKSLLNGMDLPSEIADWISSSLRGAPASGSVTREFEFRAATLRWSIVRE